MFKFILYLILFYFVIRFLRGLFQTNVVIKNYHYHTNNQQQKDEKDGKIKIIKGPDNGKHKSDGMGEYVDYEEVK